MNVPIMMDYLLRTVNKPGHFATEYQLEWLAKALSRIPILEIDVADIIIRAVITEEPVGVTFDLELLVSVLRDIHHGGPDPVAQLTLHAWIARELVRKMEEDNGCKFGPSAEEMGVLAIHVERMLKEGCRWTTDDIQEFAAGEESEVELRFWQYPSFAECTSALNIIFESEPLARIAR